ncbi:MAG: hypothetical protein H7067_08140 [Burkholderiales bacterium]|nr:hypothetical protein [Opitutaceae bacterium]
MSTEWIRYCGTCCVLAQIGLLSVAFCLGLMIAGTSMTACLIEISGGLISGILFHAESKRAARRAFPVNPAKRVP